MVRKITLRIRKRRLKFLEDGGLGKFNPHKVYREQEKQEKAVNHRSDELVQIDGETERDSWQKGETLLRVKRDRKLWRIVITHFIKGHFTQKEEKKNILDIYDAEDLFVHFVVYFSVPFEECKNIRLSQAIFHSISGHRHIYSQLQIMNHSLVIWMTAIFAAFFFFGGQIWQILTRPYQIVRFLSSFPQLAKPAISMKCHINIIKQTSRNK